MPLYTWQCENCALESGVIRRVAEIDLRPGEMEGDGEIPDCPSRPAHRWQRTIGKGQTIQKTWRWGKGKGFW